jgi:hypothetical protein
MSAKRTAVQRIATIALLALGGAVVIPAFPSAATAQSVVIRGKAQQAYAQARPKPRRGRARTRIRVTPIYPYRLESLPYPTPYPYEYPGPGAVRQCTARLVEEFRPSGTVIVPRMTCWWERG